MALLLQKSHPTLRVNLIKKIKLGNSWRFAPVVPEANGKLKDKVLISGQVEVHPEGSYFIEWREDGRRGRRFREKVFKEDAIERVRRKALELEAGRQGLIPAPSAAQPAVSVSYAATQPTPVTQATPAEKRVTIGKAIDDYLDFTETHRKKRTFTTYRYTLGTLLRAARLGLWLGLSMPQVAVIEVSDWLVANTPDLRIDVAGMTTPCSSGLQLACRYVADPEHDVVFDYLPESLMLERTHNLADFPAVLAFDKWTGNADLRQVVFSKPARARKYTATFIDQGYCFNAGEWTFPDSALRGVYARNSVYQQITGWESFEPALSRLEQIDISELWRLVKGMPEDWYQCDSEGLSRLIHTLYDRCALVRDLISQFRASGRNPFPNWKD